MGWLVYRLTHSVAMLGIVGFSTQAPTFFLTPFAGVLADRWKRHQILLWTQTLSMLQAFFLTFLVMTHWISVEWIILLSFFLGFLNAFDVPARQSFFVEMIAKREDLANAIALNSSMFNAARLVGPSLAGFLIVLGGEQLCFFVNGLSYLGVIAALASMKVVHVKKERPSANVLQGLKEGFDYVFNFLPIKALLILLACMSFVGMPYTVFMPVFARDILHGGPEMLGFLVGATGLGALTGGIYLALRKNVRFLLKKLIAAAILFGVGLMIFSLSRNVWLSMFVLVFTGFGMMLQVIATNTIIQTLVDDDKRGRVMSFYAVAFLGMTPFGSLASGWLASWIGTPATVFIGGLLCVLSAIVFMRKMPEIRQIIRPIYIQKGIIQNAT